MIIAVDIETQGLDATKFLMGAIYKENGTHKVFYDKKELWNYIIELGKREAKRQRMLSVYAHNAQYDFYGYADITDPNITYYSHNPFIASYKHEGKEIINFLDLMGIYRMSLAKVGEIIGIEKKEMPEQFKEGIKITKEELEKNKEYVIRDVEIVVKAIEHIKKKLKEEGMEIRRLFTINQIALNYLMNKLVKDERYDKLFYNRQKRRLHWSRYPEAIHKAYRGGRVEAFQTGKHKEITYIDANSLYGWASKEIRFPDVTTEKFIYEPKWEEINKEIGIAKVMIENKYDELGILQIRNKGSNYYPRGGKILIGVWTIEEIEEAIKNGYEIRKIEWAIIYEEMINPFKEITEELYKKRIAEKGFNKFFYKQMMNCSYGKLGQKRTGQIIKIDNVEKAEEYEDQGYQAIDRMGYNYVYEKREKKPKRKKYYLPIIPALITAKARIKMYQEMKKIPLKDLIYTDTDSIMFKGEHIKKFRIGEGLGEFKIEYEKKEGIIYGRKTYRIDEEMKISGFRQKGITKEEFDEGNIKGKKMETLKTTKG